MVKPAADILRPISDKIYLRRLLVKAFYLGLTVRRSINPFSSVSRTVAIAMIL